MSDTLGGVTDVLAMTAIGAGLLWCVLNAALLSRYLVRGVRPDSSRRPSAPQADALPS
jgi:hypothetical protein